MDIYELYYLVDKFGEHGLQGDVVDAVLEIIEKQSKYEQAEAEGRLVVLPVKLGEKVYVPYEEFDDMPAGIEEMTVDAMLIGYEGVMRYEGRNEYGAMMDCLYEEAYLSREEAEKALKGESSC